MQDFWQKRSAYDRWGTWIFLLLLYSLPLLALVSFCLHRDLRQDLATIRKLLQGHSRALELVGYLASLATGLLARTWPFSAATARLLGISKCLGRCAAAIFTAAQGLHALRRSLSPLDASINGLLWAAQAALHEAGASVDKWLGASGFCLPGPACRLPVAFRGLRRPAPAPLPLGSHTLGDHLRQGGGLSPLAPEVLHAIEHRLCLADAARHPEKH